MQTNRTKNEKNAKNMQTLKITKKAIEKAVERYIDTTGRRTFQKCGHPVAKNAYITRTKTSAGTPILRVRCLIDHQKQCAKAMRRLRKAEKLAEKGRH